MLELSTKPNENKNAAKIKEVLASYLYDATDSMAGYRRKDLNRRAYYAADTFLRIGKHDRKSAKKTLLENPEETMKVIGDKEKELAAAAKNYGMREKINYAVNGGADPYDSSDYFGEAFDNLPLIIGTSVIGSTATTLLHDMGAQTETGIALAATLAFVPAVKIAEKGLKVATNPKTKEQKISSAEYTAIKHSQVALKQMKKALKDEMKAEEKAEYKQMVAEAYAKTSLGVVGFLGKNGGR